MDLLWWAQPLPVRTGPAASAATLIVLGLWWNSHGRARAAPRMWLVATAGCLVALAIPLPSSPVAAGRWAALLLGPFVVALAAAEVPFRDHGRVLRAVLWVVPVAAGLGVVAWLNGQAELHQVNGNTRLLGGYANPHSAAMAMAVSAVLAAHAALGAKPRQAIGFWFMTAASLALVWAAGVRVAWLFSAVGLTVRLFGHRRTWALVMAAVAVMVVVADPERLLRWNGSLASFGSGRLDMWSHSVQGWFNAGPLAVLFGVGLGEHIGLWHKPLDPHSDLLAVAQQTGLFGVAVLSAAIFAVFTRALRHWKHPTAMLTLSLIVAAVPAAALSNAVLSRPVVGWVLGAAAGLLWSAPGTPDQLSEASSAAGKRDQNADSSKYS
jgi:hypothetical protein